MNRAGLAAAVWCAGLAACAAGQDAKVTEPYAQPLGGGAVRFFESEEAFKAAPASFVLESQKQPELPKPDVFPLSPQFEVRGDRRIITIKTPAGASLYGLGLAPGRMLRNGFTSDKPVECPWVMGVRPDGTAFGLLMDTSYACRADLTNGVAFSTESPHPGVIIWEATGPRELLLALNEQTGRMEMPPKWALGAGVRPRSTGAHVGQRLRDSRLPADFLLELWGTSSLATADRPGPAWTELVLPLDTQHIHAISDVGLALAPRAGTRLFDAGTRLDAWVTDARGNTILEPDSARRVLPDFTRKDVRTWWSTAVASAADEHVEGVWILGIRNLIPNDAAIKADVEFGGPGTGAQYARWLVTQGLRSTRDGFGAERRDRRPLVISDGHDIPRQRWAASAVTEGTEMSHWPTMGPAASLSLSLSGQPLSAFRNYGDASEPEDGDRSCDVGLGALMPLYVASGIRLDDASPVTADGARVLRTALSRRSRLIPYYYTLCFYAFRDCEPILRPLFFADPKDLALRDRDDAFFIGADLLAVPKLDKDKPKPPCPLKGGWRKIKLDDIDNPDLPDLYLRPGAILPLGPVMQYTSEKPVDPLTLLVNPDESGQATGTLYEDDGDGYAFYRNQARRIGYKAELKDGAYFVRLSTLDGAMGIPRRKLEVRVLTDSGELTATGSERGTVKIDVPKPTPP